MRSRPRNRRPDSAHNGKSRAPSRKPSRAGNPASAEPASVTSGERLQKVLARAGIASRRECEELVVEGRVEVDRKVVAELGTRVDPNTQDIRVDGEPLGKPKLAYFAVNKPVGVVSTARDPAGRH